MRFLLIVALAGLWVSGGALAQDIAAKPEDRAALMVYMESMGGAPARPAPVVAEAAPAEDAAAVEGEAAAEGEEAAPAAEAGA